MVSESEAAPSEVLEAEPLDGFVFDEASSDAAPSDPEEVQPANPKMAIAAVPPPKLVRKLRRLSW